MPLHLIKLAVGCESVKELKSWVSERMQAAKKKGLPLHHVHITRMTPKRGEELLGLGVVNAVEAAGSRDLGGFILIDRLTMTTVGAGMVTGAAIMELDLTA